MFPRRIFHSLSSKNTRLRTASFGNIWTAKASSPSSFSSLNTNAPIQTTRIVLVPVLKQYSFIKQPFSTQQSFLSNITHEDVNENADARAKIKIQILQDCKEKADTCKRAYISSQRNSNHFDNDYIQHRYKEWIKSEIDLSDAYSKAIKYTARLRNKDVARMAQDMLDEMISRHDVLHDESKFQLSHDGPVFQDRNVSDLMHVVLRKDRDYEGETLSDDVPLASARDFYNVLHSWASSKVKRKGIYAENLLYRMMELAHWYPKNFDMPDSRIFGLVVKCYSGSTLKDSLEKIQKLHKLHDRLATANIPGIDANDVFLLVHSIKSIGNYNSELESRLVDEWFDRLHKSLISKATIRDKESDVNEGDHGDPSNQGFDLSGTYNSIIRGYAKLRGKGDSADKAYAALLRMQEISKLSIQDGDEMVAMNMKVNAYNLVLDAFTMKATEEYTLRSLTLLDEMVQSMNVDNSLIPAPNDQSFANCIHALTSISDRDDSKEKAYSLVKTYEKLVKKGNVQPSTKVHNACIDVYTHLYHEGKSVSILLPLCKSIRTRMSNLAATFPTMAPDKTTYALLLKAYSFDDGDESNRKQRLEEATKIYSDLSLRPPDEQIDKLYYFMMKCIHNNLASNSEERVKQTTEVFRKAASNGMVSADVLKMLRKNLPHADFESTAGNGRLAENWICNVTSGKALYTDGTMGGEGKHARRKGKSTSDWAKKQRKRTAVIQMRKEEKAKKRQLRKQNQMRL
jgi:hypothetical protein